VWFYDDKAQVQVLFMEDKIKADKKDENIQQRVRAAAGCIAKGLQGHDLAKGRVEEIYERYDPFFGHGYHHVKATKILINGSLNVKNPLTAHNSFTDH